MHLLTKPSLSKHYLVVVAIVVLAVIIEGAVIFVFPTRGGSGAKDSRGDVTPRSGLAPKPIVPPALPPVPLFVPDYALPPVSGGLAPVITTLPTKQPVVFLGIDDGAFKDQSVVEMMQQNNIKASLFLSKLFIANNPDFFKQLIAQGSVVEDHSLSHDTKMTTTETYAQQKTEICGMADYDLLHFGQRPTLFRPPGGAYSAVMRQAAADCGMKAVVTWIAKANGGSMQYQIGKKLRPGDIVLMHFRPEFKQDMQAFIDAETAAGLHTELLESAQSGN